MRIPGEFLKITGVYGTNKNTGRIGKTGLAAAKKDVLSISGEAKDFQTVYKALKDVPDIRQNKVDELSSRVEAGSYSVTGHEVAGKVISTVFDKKA